MRVLPLAVAVFLSSIFLTVLINIENPPFGDAKLEAIPTATTKEEIELSQEEHFQKTGDFIQVLPGNTLPPEKPGKVEDYLETKIHPDYHINVYDENGVKGYQICTEDIDFLTCTGYGPQAKTFTYSIPKWQYDPRIASTTP